MAEVVGARTIAAWRVVDVATGMTTDVHISPRSRRGRKPTVKSLHASIARAIRQPAPRGAVRFLLDGEERVVRAGGVERPSFPERVEEHRSLLRKRRVPLAAECHPPTGQAAKWYSDVLQCVPATGRHVAHQIARLCGHDSQVAVPLASLADAVGRADRGGRHVAYTQRGIEVLSESGWLRPETTGPPGDQQTTYYLLPGERRVEWFPKDDAAWHDLRATTPHGE